MKKIVDKIYKAIYFLLIALIIVVTLSFVVSLLPIPGNYQIKTVLSGSMEPAIKTGAIVIVKPVEYYEVGDVINFDGNFSTLDGKKLTVTHRIIEKKVDEQGVVSYITKGDANDDQDFEEVAQRQVIGKILFDIPYVGYIFETAKKPYGFLALIMIPAGLIIFDQLKNILNEVKKVKRKNSTSEEKTEA